MNPKQDYTSVLQQFRAKYTAFFGLQGDYLKIIYFGGGVR